VARLDKSLDAKNILAGPRLVRQVHDCLGCDRFWRCSGRPQLRRSGCGRVRRGAARRLSEPPMRRGRLVLGLFLDQGG